MIRSDLLAELPFGEAAAIWLEGHRRTIAGSTAGEYEKNIKRLKEFFAALALREIHIGHFEQYQRLRSEGEGFPRPAGPSRINQELNTVSQILTRAGLWDPIAPYYQPLKLPRPKVGMALSEVEELRLFEVAGTRPRWKVAYLCSLITANTTMGPKEIRMLRIRNLSLDSGLQTPFGSIVLEEAKNQYRERRIPLNQTAGAAVRQLVARARELGSVERDHYLLPHRARGSGGEADPTRPCTSWRKAWDKLRVAAGLPHLRMYDLRHHVITKLLEDETVSERTVIELAGHVSRKMLDTYSHIRMNRKLEGVMALERRPQKKPPVTAVGFRPANAKSQ